MQRFPYTCLCHSFWQYRWLSMSQPAVAICIRPLSPALPSHDQCCMCSTLHHNASYSFALPFYGSGCCCRQFCLSSRTRPLLLWKCWSLCLSTLSPCKRVWPSGFAYCSWSCILPATTMHKLQVSSYHSSLLPKEHFKHCMLVNALHTCSSVSAMFAS